MATRAAWIDRPADNTMNVATLGHLGPQASDACSKRSITVSRLSKRRRGQSPSVTPVACERNSPALRRRRSGRQGREKSVKVDNKSRNELDPQDRSNVESFLNGIAAWESAYTSSWFAYLAIAEGAEFCIWRAQLVLTTASANLPRHPFCSARVRAGCIELREASLTPRSLIEALISGTLSIPHGGLSFRSRADGKLFATYVPFHPGGLSTYSRLDVLTITGAKISASAKTEELDWEVRAADPPFDSLDDLALTYQLGTPHSDTRTIEVLATRIVAIDHQSHVEENQANVTMLLASGLQTEQASLGYRIRHRGSIIGRGVIYGADTRWLQSESSQVGKLTIPVPTGAIVQCIARFQSSAQHRWWIHDPTTVPNPYRAAYEAFDSKLAVLRQHLTGQGKKVRDLEIAVANLLWMLGFRVAPLGVPEQLGDAPDLIAAVPEGHLLVVEVTTGLLKAESKLQRVIERTEIVRQRLVASGNSHLRLLPAMYSSKTREEIRADVAEAERLGVAVGTADDMEDFLSRTLDFVDAGQLFSELEQQVQQAQRSQESELTANKR